MFIIPYHIHFGVRFLESHYHMHKNIRLCCLTCLSLLVVVVQSLSHSCSTLCLQPHELQHARLPHPSPSPRVYSTLVHWIADAIQPAHLLLSPSLPAFNLSHHQGFVQLLCFSHYVAKVLELQHHWEYSRLISFRIDWFDLLAVQGILKSPPQHHSSKVSVLWTRISLYGATLTSVHDYWKNHSLTRQTLLGKQCLCFLTFTNNNVSALHSLLFPLKPLPIDYIHQNAGFEWLMSSNLYRHWKSEVKIILLFTFSFSESFLYYKNLSAISFY